MFYAEVLTSTQNRTQVNFSRQNFIVENSSLSILITWTISKKLQLELQKSLCEIMGPIIYFFDITSDPLQETYTTEFLHLADALMEHFLEGIDP